MPINFRKGKHPSPKTAKKSASDEEIEKLCQKHGFNGDERRTLFAILKAPSLESFGSLENHKANMLKMLCRVKNLHGMTTKGVIKSYCYGNGSFGILLIAYS